MCDWAFSSVWLEFVNGYLAQNTESFYWKYKNEKRKCTEILDEFVKLGCRPHEVLESAYTIEDVYSYWSVKQIVELK